MLLTFHKKTDGNTIRIMAALIQPSKPLSHFSPAAAVVADAQLAETNNYKITSCRSTKREARLEKKQQPKIPGVVYLQQRQKNRTWVPATWQLIKRAQWLLLLNHVLWPKF